MENNKTKKNGIYGQMGIADAAAFLHLSPDTLRRMDASGDLKADRARLGAHRFYNEVELENYLINNLISYTNKWISAKKPFIPNRNFYCPDSSVFQGRLYRLSTDLGKINSDSLDKHLLLASVGEIGDNTFGHNLGNFPDIKGLLFAYNIEKRFIVLADRGRGVLETLRKVRPNLKNDTEAIKLAFTEIISGRAPESRGNGLKFVRERVEEFPWSLLFRSGDAELLLSKTDKTLIIKKAKHPFRGCLAIINF